MTWNWLQQATTRAQDGLRGIANTGIRAYNSVVKKIIDSDQTIIDRTIKPLSVPFARRKRAIVSSATIGVFGLALAGVAQSTGIMTTAHTASGASVMSRRRLQAQHANCLRLLLNSVPTNRYEF